MLVNSKFPGRNSPNEIDLLSRVEEEWMGGEKEEDEEEKLEYTVENLLEVITDNAPQRCKFRAAGVNLSALGDWSTSVPWRLAAKLKQTAGPPFIHAA